MEPEGSLPHSQEPATCPHPKNQSRSEALCCVSYHGNFFYGEELLAPRPIPNLEAHPLSTVRDCLFSVFAATLHIRRPFRHPQPEDAPCRGDRGPLIMDAETCTWQNTTFKRDRHPCPRHAGMIEPAIPASMWLQTHALDRAATGIGMWYLQRIFNKKGSLGRKNEITCHYKVKRSSFIKLKYRYFSTISDNSGAFIPNRHQVKKSVAI
jgi:hypothetical protein